MTLPVVMIIPVVAYIATFRPAHNDLETVIKRAGFDPLLPPNRLRGPGALYEVEGRFYRKVCDIDPDMLQGKVRTSPIESQIRERLAIGRFSLGGEFVETLNAKLGASRIASIEYRLTDATVSEIALSDLSEIEDKLLRKKYCDETVQRLLKAHRKVCPGYAVLSATTFYKVNVSSKFESNAESMLSSPKPSIGGR